MKSLGKKLFLLLALLWTVQAQAQKMKLIEEYEAVVTQAKTELDSSLKSGHLNDCKIKLKLKGEYIMNVTIGEKGKVLSVYTISNDTDDIPMQNKVKDCVRTQTFNFKMPKGKTYKFEYTFNF
ncbi:MAG: hypothetical protein RIQ89_2235 [Bacteroidota bacterium]|jgi:hypothetical protein